MKLFNILIIFAIASLSMVRAAPVAGSLNAPSYAINSDENGTIIEGDEFIDLDPKPMPK